MDVRFEERFTELLEAAAVGVESALTASQ